MVFSFSSFLLGSVMIWRLLIIKNGQNPNRMAVTPGGNLYKSQR